MVSFLFWNLGGSNEPNVVRDVCSENGVDIVILAECATSSREIIRHLNETRTGGMYLEFAAGPTTLRLFTRLPLNWIEPIYDESRVSMRHFKMPVGQDFLLVAAHLPSKLHLDEGDQYFIARNLRNSIESAEGRVGHRNSIIIGDLNMNPFEDGMIALDGLHGMMDQDLALRPDRSYRGSYYSYFYNPMWSRMGDQSRGPSGTYFYNSSSSTNYGWNTFDQILIRPSLIPYFQDENLEVITTIGGVDILAKSRISDHYPILFNLPLERMSR